MTPSISTFEGSRSQNVSDTEILNIRLGEAMLSPIIVNGYLQSLGAIEVSGVPLRNPATRFLPWVDTYEGGVFNRFRFLGMESAGEGVVIRTEAMDDSDYPFRERRDSSGDICFRVTNWDAPPTVARLDIHFQPASHTINSYQFKGFKYWFSWAPVDGSVGVQIHRLLDRQTWEIGGELDGIQLLCRNWLTPPRFALSTAGTYSTVGLEDWAGLLPGNLWARWSLLPSFDLQYSSRGVLLGRFDEVSLTRSVLETNGGENQLRVLDMHLFEQSETIATNPKSILFCSDQLDDIEAINLWTRIQDEETARARAQFQLPPEQPPALVLSQNDWRNVNFATSYQHSIDVAAELGMDLVFIDSVFEHWEAYDEALQAVLATAPDDTTQRDPILNKMDRQNMCVTLDFEVARQWGGEEGLSRLCREAAARGVGIMSWMATHVSPNSILRCDQSLGAGKAGIYAARESGSPPDTGYTSSCWTLNLNTPILQKITGQLIGVCERTGLQGYLWDSFSNLGWWQLDYSQGTMRPQHGMMMQLYRDMENAGLYLMPEAIVQFSSHSCCGLHGGDVYAGELAPFAYASNIGLAHGKYERQGSPENMVIRGMAPFSILFEAVAHKRVPSFCFSLVPREEWDVQAVAQIRELFGIYKRYRHAMTRRTLLAGGTAVLWESDDSTRLLFVLEAQAQALAGSWADVLTGAEAARGAELQSCRVYVER